MSEISVVMPVYNGLPYLREAVESVLAQRGVDFELLVFNDASDDGSGEYLDQLRDERVRVFHCEKQGYAPLLNRGLEEARSALIARLDADDVSLDGWLAAQCDALRKNPEIVVSGCQAALIDGEGRSIGAYNYPLTDAGIRFRLLTCCALTHPGVAYRRNAVLNAGGYDVEKVPCEDYDLWGRMITHGRLCNLTRPFVKYRIHGNNISFQRKQRRDEVNDAVAIRQLLAEGVATNAEDAQEFIRLRRKFNPDSIEGTSLEDGSKFSAYALQFISHYCQERANCREQVAEVRQSIRWQFLQRAKMTSMLSREYFGWLRLAARIDPQEMRPRRVFYRVARSVLGRCLPKSEVTLTR